MPAGAEEKADGHVVELDGVDVDVSKRAAGAGSDIDGHVVVAMRVLVYFHVHRFPGRETGAAEQNVIVGLVVLLVGPDGGELGGTGVGVGLEDVAFGDGHRHVLVLVAPQDEIEPAVAVEIHRQSRIAREVVTRRGGRREAAAFVAQDYHNAAGAEHEVDRKSTRLNSIH